MTWRQHLRDLVLAGGALAAAACSATSGGGGGPPGGTFCCNANPDPCCESDYCGADVSDACACKQKGGDWQIPAPDGGFACTFTQDAGPPDTGVPCCNANPDPCCPSQYCGEPVSAACQCKQDGGTWDYSAADGGRCDGADAGPTEAGPTEAGPANGDAGDAAADPDAHT